MRLLNRTGREKLAGKLCQKKSLPLSRTKEAPRLLEPLGAQPLWQRNLGDGKSTHWGPFNSKFAHHT